MKFSKNCLTHPSSQVAIEVAAVAFKEEVEVAAAVILAVTNSSPKSQPTKRFGNATQRKNESIFL